MLTSKCNAAGLTSISDEILQKLGKSGQPSLVKFLDGDGGGYMATMEVSHQLHCLVSFFRATFDRSRQFANSLRESATQVYLL